MSGTISIHVSFRKQVSDGNYGTEAAECSLEYELSPGQDGMDCAQVLLSQARDRVHAELAHSPSPAVVRALQPPPPPRSFGRSVPAEPVDDDVTEMPF
jgi:hypothetical protein